MELSDVITEDWLIEELGLTKQQIYRMRKGGLVHIPIGRTKRLYDAHDVARYLESVKRSGAFGADA